METVLHGVAIYVFLVLVFRLIGKRSLGDVTTFDFVLLLIIGESTQQALLGEDYSLTNAALMIVTLVGLDVGLSLVKQRFPRLERWLEDLPLVLVENGKPLRERLDKVRVGEDDILESARRLQGLERMEQIKYAVLERNGDITIIPAARPSGPA